MKTKLVLLALLCSQTLSMRAEGDRTNDIALPSELYMLSGVSNNIFVQPFVRRYKPADYCVRFSGVPFSKRDDELAQIAKPQSGVIKFELYETDDFKLLKSVDSKINVAEPFIGDNQVVVQVLGDSYTHGGFFKNALLEKKYVPNVKMVGLRKVGGYSDQFDEGRGGWTLAKYFSAIAYNQNSPKLDSYNGYFQPVGDFKYWGITEFWKLAIAVGNSPKVNPATGNPWSFNESYSAGRYEEAAKKFDPNTGLLISPKDGDIMYDSQKNSFVIYKNKRWNVCSYSDYDWSFQYDKYLTMWGIEAPKFLFVLLGLNDFRSKYNNLDFTTWNEQIETVKNSYMRAVPDGKFIICLPCSSCGIMNNENGDFTLMQNAAMWEHRKNIIDKFDNRKSDGYFIVDTGLAIDNVNGYRFKDGGVQTGNPHPYLSYPQIGVPIAAFIQYHRGK